MDDFSVNDGQPIKDYRTIKDMITVLSPGTQHTLKSTSCLSSMIWELTDCTPSLPSLKPVWKSLHYTVVNSVTVNQIHLKSVLSEDFGQSVFFNICINYNWTRAA